MPTTNFTVVLGKGCERIQETNSEQCGTFLHDSSFSERPLRIVVLISLAGQSERATEPRLVWQFLGTIERRYDYR